MMPLRGTARRPRATGGWGQVQCGLPLRLQKEPGLLYPESGLLASRLQENTFPLFEVGSTQPRSGTGDDSIPQHVGSPLWHSWRVPGLTCRVPHAPGL